MNSGVSFDSQTGTLYDVRRDGTIAIRGWPTLTASRITPGEPSADYRPNLRLPAGDLDARLGVLRTPQAQDGQLLLGFAVSRGERRRSRAEIGWLRWCQTIPTDVREVVTRFHRDHWDLLLLLSRCGRPAFDLATTNPALAFAVIRAWDFRRSGPVRSRRGAWELLQNGAKQREILGWLGFPETDAARRLLAKVPHRALSVAFLQRLRRALHDPDTARTLARLPRVNAGALRIASDPALRDRVAPALLLEVCRASAEDRRSPTPTLLRRALDLTARYLPGRQDDRRFRSIAELGDIHRGLVAVEAQCGPYVDGVAFPRPPLPGTKTIVPITSVIGLIEEGWDQRHCAARYVQRVLEEQDAYFYRVLAPERCTLMLALERGDWIARQIRRACNGEVSLDTLRTVRDWLARMTGLPPGWSIARELDPDYIVF